LRSIDGNSGRQQPSLPPTLREDQAHHRHPELDRHPEAIVRRISSSGSRPEARKDLGLQGVFKSVFPIKDFNETASLEFVGFSLGTRSTTSKNATSAA